MSELTSKFSRDDVETLLEAMNDWESLGSQEWHFMNMVMKAPMPPDDHEAYEIMTAIKDHYKKRERSIRDSRVTRQEKATFLKAKLMMIRGQIGINQLFEVATETSTPVSREEIAETEATEHSDSVTIPVKGSDAEQKLERAEYFIRDLGVWDHYQKFLSEDK